MTENVCIDGILNPEEMVDRRVGWTWMTLVWSKEREVRLVFMPDRRQVTDAVGLSGWDVPCLPIGFHKQPQAD